MGDFRVARGLWRVFFPGPAMVGDDLDIRNRVAHVLVQLQQISEGSGRINARDTWLTVTLAIA